MRIAGRAAVVAVVLGAMASASQAESVSYCVTCSEPAQTYVCRVDTPDGSPGAKALQLYCMVKTAKDGGHRSCSAGRETTGQCPGLLKTYTYDGPGGLPGIRSAIRHYRGDKPAAPTAPTAPEPPTASEPKKPSTLFGLTSRGVKKTGGAVVKVTKGAGGVVGDAARGAKRRVGNAGSAIGNAARSALDCVKKLFRGCGDDESDEAAEATAEPLSLAPEKPKTR